MSNEPNVLKHRTASWTRPYPGATVGVEGLRVLMFHMSTVVELGRGEDEVHTGAQQTWRWDVS